MAKSFLYLSLSRSTLQHTSFDLINAIKQMFTETHS